jgi:protein-L-isoaspartate(D-aspartate) O-methyltransferase
MLQLISREVGDERVIAAMAQVPREEFVLPELVRYAYDDRALPIGNDQTISQPLIVAIMTDALRLTGVETVLEVGTGSGYQAAILSLLAERVISVERVAELRERAGATLARLGFVVEIHDPGESLGWPANGPYQGIIVTAAAPVVPNALLDQLAVGGRLLIPVGERRGQHLLRLVKHEGGVTREDLGPCGFVPLIGEEAFPDEDSQR